MKNIIEQLSISKIELKKKRVLVRADLNVPLRNGLVTDETRIKVFSEGIRPLLLKGAKIIILTHLGRPKGKFDKNYSVKNILENLSNNLNLKIQFAKSCINSETLSLTQKMKEGDIILCENVRFYKEEEENDQDFAMQLSKLGDIYINDAFSCSHRAHASTYAITKFMPSFAGPLFIQEINALSMALENPKAPSIAIVGGAKVSTKISVLKNLVKKLDSIIIGGGMANTFLFAKGAPMGRSLHEPTLVKTAKEILYLAEQSNCKILLPKDIVIAKDLKPNSNVITVNFNECPSDFMILDAGMNSIEIFKNEISKAKTILWNGPLGAFEVPPFDKSTVILAKKAAELTRERKCITVAGGGDTIAALNMAGVTKEFTYISNAGGAFLEWLEGGKLQGIKALEEANNIY